MNEEHTPQQNNETETPSAWKNNLCTVTPFSKYLAMTLFIAMPFLGFWGGRLFEQALQITSDGSDELCELRLLQCQSASTITPPKNEESKEEAFKIFSDPDTGVSFTYPPQWGEVTVNNERGECAESLKDPCNMRTYSFEDLAAGGVFLVMETSGHEESPLPRGGFWGDDIGGITASFADDCSQDTSCVLFSNDNDVIFAKRTAEVFDWNMEGDSAPLEVMYDTYSDKGSYYGVRLSPLGIKDAGDSVVQEFETTVVASLKLGAHR